MNRIKEENKEKKETRKNSPFIDGQKIQKEFSHVYAKS